jgi:hypothetical protein
VSDAGACNIRAAVASDAIAWLKPLSAAAVASDASACNIRAAVIAMLLLG